MATDDHKPISNDVRILERKLRRGLISRKDHDKYLKSLPDRADNAIPLSLDIGPDDTDDER